MSPRSAIPKSAVTRERLFTTALALFEERGFEATTMRQIATAGGCSLGLTYRYFAAKEELALELYGRIAGEFVRGVPAIPTGSLADRFEAAMKLKFELMSRHRSTLLGLFGVALSPTSRAAALGNGSKAIRDTVRSGLLEVVTGARDLRRSDDVEELTKTLYLIHLALVLVWCSDRTEYLSATQKVLSSVAQMVAGIRRVQRLPFVRSSLASLLSALGEIIT